MVARQFLQIDPGPAPALLTRPVNATIETNLGRISIELLAQEAPASAAWFAHLVRSGYYDRLPIATACRGGLDEPVGQRRNLHALPERVARLRWRADRLRPRAGRPRRARSPLEND